MIMYLYMLEKLKILIINGCINYYNIKPSKQEPRKNKMSSQYQLELRQQISSGAARMMANLHSAYFATLRADQMRQFMNRRTYVELYGWMIPRGGLIRLIRRLAGNSGNVLFPAAGLGFLPYLLTTFINSDGHAFPASRVIATDITPPPNPFLPIQQEDGLDTAMESHDNDTMVISWAPYASPLAFRMVQAFKGHTIIVIGESEGGCTANDAFFEELETNWTPVPLASQTLIYSWPCVHDEVTAYTRR